MCDNEDQVRQSTKREVHVVNAHVRQFTSGFAHSEAYVRDSAAISRPILIIFGT